MLPIRPNTGPVCSVTSINELVRWTVDGVLGQNGRYANHSVVQESDGGPDHVHNRNPRMADFHAEDHYMQRNIALAYNAQKRVKVHHTSVSTTLFKYVYTI